MVAEAARAGLRYIDGDVSGYRRRRTDDGFNYFQPDGQPLVSRPILERIDALAIPPNWTDVWICRSEDGHLQATGRDDAGRKQYIYHEHWEEHRARSRCANIIGFGRRLGDFRDQVSADMRRRSLGRDRVCAVACAVLDRTHMRIGQEYYDREHGTHGLTTLRKDEVQIGSQLIKMHYIGKGSLERSIEFSERRIARQLRRIAELPGDRLMQYERDGVVHHLAASQVNDYIKTHLGDAFSAKDFRTWGGTVHCLQALLDGEPPLEEKACHKRLVEAVKATAQQLGNTPAVCRNHYIHVDLLRFGAEPDLWPHLLQAITPTSNPARDPRLDVTEAQLLAVLDALAA